MARRVRVKKDLENMVEEVPRELNVSFRFLMVYTRGKIEKIKLMIPFIFPIRRGSAADNWEWLGWIL